MLSYRRVLAHLLVLEAAVAGPGGGASLQGGVPAQWGSGVGGAELVVCVQGALGVRSCKEVRGGKGVTCKLKVLRLHTAAQVDVGQAQDVLQKVLRQENEPNHAPTYTGCCSRGPCPAMRHLGRAAGRLRRRAAAEAAATQPGPDAAAATHRGTSGRACCWCPLRAAAEAGAIAGCCRRRCGRARRPRPRPRRGPAASAAARSSLCKHERTGIVTRRPHKELQLS